MTIILDECGSWVEPDNDAFYEAIRPFQEMERREAFEGPCEDDCQVTAEMIDGSSGPFDPDFGAELRAFEKFLQTGIYPSGLYPEVFWDGPQPLPCGGLLTNLKMEATLETKG